MCFLLIPAYTRFDIYMFWFIRQLPLFFSSFLLIMNVQNNLSFYSCLHAVAFLVARAIITTQSIHLKSFIRFINIKLSSQQFTKQLYRINLLVIYRINLYSYFIFYNSYMKLTSEKKSLRQSRKSLGQSICHN